MDTSSDAEDDIAQDTAEDAQRDANGDPKGWAKSYVSSGTGYEQPNDIITTDDGGFLVCGEHSDDVRNYDAWLVKLDADGDVDWERAFGGGNVDRCSSVIETDDGGYLAVGVEYSSDAEPPSNGWIVKVDSSGIIEWEHNYGGAKAEWFRDVVQNAAGYLVVGNTASYGQGGSCGQIGCNDALVMQIDDAGGVDWARAYGGADAHEYGRAVVMRSETDYVIAGGASSFGQGTRDGFLFAIDQTGDIQWQKTYGTAAGDDIYALQLGDGDSLTVGGVTQHPERGTDHWVARLDASGSQQWQKIIGDATDEGFSDLLIDGDGAIVFTGDAPVPEGGRASVVTKLAPDGSFAWRRHFGLNLEFEANWAYAVTESSSHYVVAGITNWVQASNGDMMLAAFDPSTGELGCGLDSAYTPTIEDAQLIAADGDAVTSNPTVARGNLNPTELQPTKTTEALCPE
jgi:hypothetical protein